MNRHALIVLRLVLVIVLITAVLTSAFQPQSAVSAAAVLTISPLTWNIIGLERDLILCLG